MSEHSPDVDPRPSDDVVGATEAESTPMTGADDDLASLLLKREHARPNRITWVLLTLLVLAVGFASGAVAYDRFGPSASGSSGGLPDFSSIGGFPGGFPGAPGSAASSSSTLGGTSGAGNSFGGATAGLTAGTVKLVDGDHLYLTDATGATVKVTVPATATVTSQQEVPLSSLPAGTTVVVRGETGGDGTVTATSVSEGGVGGAPAGSARTPAETTSGTTPSTTTGSTASPPAAPPASTQGDN